MDDMMFESMDEPTQKHDDVEIDMGTSESDDMLPTQQEPEKINKIRKREPKKVQNGKHGKSEPSASAKKEKKNDVTEKEKTNGNKKKNSKKSIDTKKSDKMAKLANRTLERNCIKMLEDYEDPSVVETVEEFISNLENISDRGKRNYEKGGSAYFAMADGNKHLRRAGIVMSKKDTQALVERIAEIHMIAMTSRTLPHMNQDKRTTIFAKDVYQAQNSTGHAFV